MLYWPWNNIIFPSCEGGFVLLHKGVFYEKENSLYVLWRHAAASALMNICKYERFDRLNIAVLRASLCYSLNFYLQP